MESFLLPWDSEPTDAMTLTPEQLQELRQLIEQNGFLPMTNKAMRLFAAAEARHPADQTLLQLKKMFEEAGYLPRSKAIRLVELAS
jgi:hypothetical protein